MKKLMSLAVLAAGAAIQLAAAVPLGNFAEVYAALKGGQQVRAVFHYKIMALTIEGRKEERVPDAVGGMDLGTFEYFGAGAVGNKEGFLSASHTQIIRHPRFGIVLNYVKVSLMESNVVRILVQYLDPMTYAVKMDEMFETIVATGRNRGGAFFFRLD
jgi:hypothetical protein